MVKTIQYANEHCLFLKQNYVCLKEKEAYKS